MRFLSGEFGCPSPQRGLELLGEGELSLRSRASENTMSFFKRLRITLEMIKFEHTVFALPFALLSAILASGGWPEAPKLFWIVMAMVGCPQCCDGFQSHRRPAD